MGCDTLSMNNRLSKIQQIPTLWLHDICPEVLAVYDNELRLFKGQDITPCSPYKCHVPYIAAVGNIFTSLVKRGVEKLRIRHLSAKIFANTACLLALQCKKNSNIHK